MKLRVWFEGALAFGAGLAVVGGATLATLHLVDPTIALIPRIEEAYRHVMFGFFFLTLFSVAAVMVSALGRSMPAPPPPAPVPAPAVEPTEEAKTDEQETPKPALADLYHEMKTYVELEMWEPALEKADRIVRDHPGTREAELVERNLNELRWKAEPKYMSDQALSTVERERQLRQKGLTQMLQHVKTYMDLEMWELARQKSLLVIKKFPDTPEAGELTRLFPRIEEKIRATVSAGKTEA